VGTNGSGSSGQVLLSSCRQEIVQRLWQAIQMEIFDSGPRAVVNIHFNVGVCDGVERHLEAGTHLCQICAPGCNNPCAELCELIIQDVEKHAGISGRLATGLQGSQHGIAMFEGFLVGAVPGQVLRRAVEDGSIEEAPSIRRASARYLEVFGSEQDRIELAKVLRYWPNDLAV